MTFNLMPKLNQRRTSFISRHKEIFSIFFSLVIDESVRVMYEDEFFLITYSLLKVGMSFNKKTSQWQKENEKEEEEESSL